MKVGLSNWVYSLRVTIVYRRNSLLFGAKQAVFGWMIQVYSFGSATLRKYIMPKPAIYQVVEILDDGVPLYVAMQRIGEPYLDLVWKCRHAVDNALCCHLRTLEAKPQTRVVLGNTSPLTWRTARALMHYQRQQVAEMAGSDGPPDFALWPAVNRGGCRSQRKCVRVRGGVVQGFGSVEEAARTVETSMDDIAERIDSGHLDRAGWAWLDGEPQKHTIS